jgi:hypothetical protein
MAASHCHSQWSDTFQVKVMTELILVFVFGLAATDIILMFKVVLWSFLCNLIGMLVKEAGSKSFTFKFQPLKQRYVLNRSCCPIEPMALLSVTNVVSHHIIVTCKIYCHFVIGMLCCCLQAQELLEGQKVLDWLKEHAEITYVTPQ